jgi:hypothetical protein
MTISPFLTALGSEGPPADRAKDMDLYGWLIGSMLGLIKYVLEAREAFFR